MIDVFKTSSVEEIENEELYITIIKKKNLIQNSFFESIIQNIFYINFFII